MVEGDAEDEKPSWWRERTGISSTCHHTHWWLHCWPKWGIYAMIKGCTNLIQQGAHFLMHLELQGLVLELSGGLIMSWRLWQIMSTLFCPKQKCICQILLLLLPHQCLKFGGHFPQPIPQASLLFSAGKNLQVVEQEQEGDPRGSNIT